MKEQVLLAVFLVPLIAAAETSSERRMEALEQEFRFDRAISDPVLEMPEDAEDVVWMETLTVTDSMLRRQMAATIDGDAKRTKDEAFSWKRGGLIRSFERGGRQIDLGVWPTIETESFQVELKPILRVRLIHIRW